MDTNNYNLQVKIGTKFKNSVVLYVASLLKLNASNEVIIHIYQLIVV